MPIVSDKYRGTTMYFHVLAELVRAAQYRGLTTYYCAFDGGPPEFLGTQGWWRRQSRRGGLVGSVGRILDAGRRRLHCPLCDIMRRGRQDT